MGWTKDEFLTEIADLLVKLSHFAVRGSFADTACFDKLEIYHPHPDVFRSLCDKPIVKPSHISIENLMPSNLFYRNDLF